MSTSSHRRSSHTLPPTHFLSLAPAFATPAINSSPTTLSLATTVSARPAAYTPTGASNVPAVAEDDAFNAVNTATTASADFEVDVRTGFLPFEPAISDLRSIPIPIPSSSSSRDRVVGYEIWEEALWSARGEGVVGKGLRLNGGEDGVREAVWRKGIEEMPVLPIQPLSRSLPHLRRAHQVLTFLLHFYVHSQPLPTASNPRTAPIPIPASISIPITTTSNLLGLPPILTYADTVLYNSHPKYLEHPPSIEMNPYEKVLESFTNTPDEDHFYLTSTKCELLGVNALTLMRNSMDEAFMADPLALTRLTTYLRELGERIDEIGEAILSMREGCRPEVFYHVVRPWFRGGDADGPGSVGWAFLGLGKEAEKARDEGEEEEQIGAEFVDERERQTGGNGSGVKARKFSGPSAGQSSLIHAIDVFLNVTHAPVEDSSSNTPPADTSATTDAHAAAAAAKGKRTAETTFMTRMLEYMPAPHRAFLLNLHTHPHPIRSLVLAHQADRPKLVEAYDSAVEALKRLREKHMRIASIYIIQQARRPVTPELIALGAAAPVPSESAQAEGKKKLKAGDLSEFIAEEEAKQVEGDEEVRGTGGTALIKFLKMCRDNTGRTAIGMKRSEGV